MNPRPLLFAAICMFASHATGVAAYSPLWEFRYPYVIAAGAESPLGPSIGAVICPAGQSVGGGCPLIRIHPGDVVTLEIRQCSPLNHWYCDDGSFMACADVDEDGVCPEEGEVSFTHLCYRPPSVNEPDLEFSYDGPPAMLVVYAFHGLDSPVGPCLLHWGDLHGTVTSSTLGRDAHCSDGIDNDGDDLIDFGSDAGCGSALDDSERPAPLVYTALPSQPSSG